MLHIQGVSLHLNWIVSDESDKLDSDDHPDVDELKSVALSLLLLDVFSDKDIHLNSLIEMGSDDGKGGKSCTGSMGSSFDVCAGLGQNTGLESTLMVLSPFKSRMGDKVKDDEIIVSARWGN